MLGISTLQASDGHTRTHEPHALAGCQFHRQLRYRGDLLAGNKDEGSPGAHLLHQQVFKQCTSDRHCMLRLDPAVPELVSPVLTIKDSVVTAGLSNRYLTLAELA